MTQIISVRFDRALRRGLRVVPLLALAMGALGFYYYRSDAYGRVGDTATQPIPFRHDLHVREIGLQCAFCHGGATTQSAAGMPSAETCLVCHQRLWRGTAATQPLHTSVSLGQPIVWQSLYALPAHARFHHGAHAVAGVECSVCHGDVAGMVRTQRARPMSMAWCLECHFAAGDRADLAPAAAWPREPHEHANPRLTDCSTCHY